MPNNDLKIFLEKHSKLKHFESDYCFLMSNQSVLAGTNIHLDSIGIHFEGRSAIVRQSFDRFLNSLPTLHARGLYKSLYVSFDNSTGIQFDDLTSDTILALPGLVSLRNVRSTIDLSRLIRFTELTELVLDLTMTNQVPFAADTLAKSLVNLKQLTLNGTDVDILHVSAFIHYSEKLEMLIVHHIPEALDLFALHQERKKLPNPCQVSIGLWDRAYLLTRWKSNVSYFSHVKITRLTNWQSLFLDSNQDD